MRLIILDGGHDNYFEEINGIKLIHLVIKILLKIISMKMMNINNTTIMVI